MNGKRFASLVIVTALFLSACATEAPNTQKPAATAAADAAAATQAPGTTEAAPVPADTAAPADNAAPAATPAAGETTVMTPTTELTPTEGIAPSGEVTPTVEVAPSEGTTTTATTPALDVTVVETTVVSLVARVNLNVRSGPGLDYEIVARASAGRVFQVTGASADALWYRVQCEADPSGNCWVTSDSRYVTARTDSK